MKKDNRMMKFGRIVALYFLFFFPALFIGGIFFSDSADGIFALFVLLAPGVAVWLYENRRDPRSTAKPSVEKRLIEEKPSDNRRALQRPTAPVYRSQAAAQIKYEAGKPSRRQGWVPRGEEVIIYRRKINGMVYIGRPPTVNTYGYGEKCRAYIDPSLMVSATEHDRDGRGMPYWPGYSTIPPECRATYLDWLAAGAKDSSYSPGYMFLYFYGLERRFFVDEPDAAEKNQILDEVRRLAGLFAHNRSAQRYLSEFIDFALATTSDMEDIDPVFENPHWDMPLPVKLAIGCRLEKGETLNADWVLSWFLCHPEKSLRTSGKRCRDEFVALFRLRFEERFPQGLKVNKPRKSLQISYQAASREFNGSAKPTVNGKPVPDISSLRKPVEIAQEIADEVQDDLDKFSRYLGRNPDGRGSVEAHALLPAELRKMFPSKEMEEIKAWAASIVECDGLVPVGDVVQRLEGERPEKLGKRKLTGAADALARLGFGLAPDPRFALRSPQLHEPVVLFDLGGSVEQLEKVSTTYKVALIELALASFVAHSDGVIAEAQRQHLDAQACAVDGLTDHEQRRLQANLTWFLAVPPDMTLLRRKLKETGAGQQSAFRMALIGAAHADGIVKPEEVSGIEKVYRALGLDPNLVYSDLHSGEIADAPQRVRKARPGKPGEAIPEESRAPAQSLDTKRIASIRKDTDRVSAVLEGIFGSDLDQDENEHSAAASTLAGLDEKHTALVREIITRQHWSEADFTSLAERHQLMVAGALETINEWSFGVYDEALLDEYEGYEVSADISEALADEFE